MFKQSNIRKLHRQLYWSQFKLITDAAILAMAFPLKQPEPHRINLLVFSCKEIAFLIVLKITFDKISDTGNLA
jgi:hypothetical protein